MSETTQTTQPVMPAEVVVKQSFVNRRIVTPIRNHPKIALAVVAGLALVGAATLVAKNDDSSTSDASSPAEVVEDTNVA